MDLSLKPVWISGGKLQQSEEVGYRGPVLAEATGQLFVGQVALIQQSL